MDHIDQHLLTRLLHDGRATYQELGRQVRLSSNTVADRVRRLRHPVSSADTGPIWVWGHSDAPWR